MRTRIMGIALVAALTATVPTALAQHEHGKEQEHGKPAKFTMPTRYSQAVQEIQSRLAAIEQLIKAKHLDDVHAEADVIKQIGNKVGELAAKPDSGVPKDAVKEVNQAGRSLAGKFDAIDKAGDAGDAAGTRKVYDEMVVLTATLQKYVAKTYQCPMKCEGDKTYAAPGKCPKCNMALKEVASHGPHGGLLVTAPDGKHQVEATLSADGQLCIYLCDAQAKPIPADRVAAQARIGKKGAAEAEFRPLAVAVDSTKSFLSGKTDASTKTPLAAVVSVDFKDGQKPQTFTFEFDGPTKADKDVHDGHKDDEHKGHKP
ncbi:hypothetical protein RAS1_09010 [Phycisphaerae bacterium RAS1]|nr:hypothetical protein RAS1_09010 [Phycisphaerae bacterium RAS1]